MEKPNYNEEDLSNHYGVAAVIKNNEGKILMQEQTKYGFWTIPVGKVALTEDILEGLKKEILEETNLVIENCEKLVSKLFQYERNGKLVNVTSNMFEVISHSGNLRNKEPEKHKQQLFLSLEEIKNLEYLSDMTLLYLEHLGIKRPAKLS